MLVTNGDGLFVGDTATGAASSKSPNSSSSGSFGDVCSIFVTFVTAEDVGDTEEVTSEDVLVTELLTGLVTVLESIALRYSEEKSKLKLGTIGKLDLFELKIQKLFMVSHLAIEFRSIVALGLRCTAATSPMQANNSL